LPPEHVQLFLFAFLLFHEWSMLRFASFSKEKFSCISLVCQEKYGAQYMGLLQFGMAERVVNGCKKRGVDVITYQN